jgi:hypothetical protein
VFGAGGGTSSYREAEDADLPVLWGSNAREAHPIFFHHVLRGLRKGARSGSLPDSATNDGAALPDGKFQAPNVLTASASPSPNDLNSGGY